MTHILIPREPSPALLRPFVSCPQEELPQAYAAMIRIAEVERARAGSQCLAQIEEPAGAAPAAAPTPMAWPVAREELLDWARFADTAKGYSDLPNIRYSMGTLAMVLTNLASKAPMAAPAAPWKDHQTARLVNDLRDCAIKYHGAGQLRERIAHIVVPLCDQLKGALAAPAAPAVDAQPLIARSIAEWHEDDGDVSWWAWCGHGWAGEPAWIGRPTDDGWPGYHTHWTAHPAMPPAIAAQAAAKGSQP